MSLINREVYWRVTLWDSCIIINITGESNFSATNTKFKVPVVILYCYDNNKQLQQLKTSFKKKIYWNQYTRNLQVYDTS